MTRKMTLGLAGVLAAVATVPFVVSTQEAEASQDALALLEEFDAGEWEIRYRDTGSSERICVRSGAQFVQIRHRGAACRRFVVEDGANEVTVQYTCKGNGYGRTNIRRETARLAQIEGQGIAGGSPFQFSAEARRVGSCR